MDNKELKRAGLRDTPERKSRCSFDQAAGQKMSRHADQSRSSAARQRRHHARIVSGKMIVPVEISDVAVPQALISVGLLAPGAGEDRAAIGHALERLIEALVGPDASARDP